MTTCSTKSFVLAFTIVMITIAPAQTGTSSVFGLVSDPQGAAIGKATITLTDSQGQARTTTSGADGTYQFLALPPGTYSIRVEASGFNALRRDNIELLVDTRVHQDFSMQVSGVVETVQVSGAIEALNTSDASVGTVITPTQVANLPLEALNPVGLLTLQAGVTFTGDPTDRRSGAVAGARSDQITVTLDGTDVNDTQTQQAMRNQALPIPLESIQEFRFTTGNANADAGRSGGGQVSFITKSGTNTFHGSLFEAHRNTATSANDWFNRRQQILSSVKNSPPPLIRNVFGGALGGPIQKDRMFFFITYEGTRTRTVQNALRIVPSDTLRSGQLRYPTASGAVQTLTSTDVRTVDPAGIGVNPAMLNVLQAYPRCNDLNQGLDNGLNFCGFRFNAPIATDKNIYVAKLDYHLTRDGRHAISWRGTLGNADQDTTEQLFPGMPTQQKTLDNSKGYTATYTALLRPNLTSVFRYGFTRQGVDLSGQPNPTFTIRSFDPPYSAVRATVRKLPNHNLVEDMSWQKGNHTFQWGANIRLDRNDRTTTASSFSGYAINDGFCATLCGTVRANINSGTQFPAIPSSFSNPFKRAIMALYGTITQISTSYIFDGKQNQPASGQPVSRSFLAREQEYYFQDVWRATKDLTLTAGLRFSYYGVPWEEHGLQTQTTVNIRDWFLQRANAQFQGVSQATLPLLQYDRSGPGVGKKGFYDPDYHNFAPSLAFAYSPSQGEGVLSKIFGGPGNSVLRGGFRMVYDRIGGAFTVSNDLNGAFGLVSNVINLSGTLDYSGPTCPPAPTTPCAAPRFSGFNSLPNVAAFTAAPSQGFPSTPPANLSNLGFAIDSRLRTPYTYIFNLSFGRQLPGNFVVETTYQGRVSHKLLAKADYAAPLIYFIDQKSGMNASQAINQLYLASGKETVGTSGAALASIQTIPFFENVFPGLTGTCGAALPNCTATQAFYRRFEVPNFTDFTDTLFFADTTPRPPATTLPSPVFFQQQFSSLPVWTNLGRSNYHALEVALRRRLSAGLLFDVNYTFSKSIDNGSEIENVTRLTGQIADAFFPNNFSAVSDFDIKHQVTADYVYDLPIGKGKMLGGDGPAWLDQIIGGWGTSGIVRVRSALPVSIGNGFNFPTNFFLTGPGTQVCPMQTNLAHFGPKNSPNLFGDQSAVDAAFKCNDYTLTGGSGSRNILRGAPFALVDLGVSKAFRLPIEGHRLIFRAQAFNAFNHPNFDDRFMSLSPDNKGTYGQYTQTIGADERGNNARVFQFALRYEF